MKIRTKAKRVVFIGNCDNCGTEFELTRKEKAINEILFADVDRKGRRQVKSNNKKFYCPVCEKVSEFHDLRKTFIMEGGLEHTVW